MSKAIELAVQHIYNEIPRELLDLTFNDRPRTSSLDEQVIKNVIRRVVLKDINIFGGRVVEIELRKDWEVNINTEEERGTYNRYAFTCYNIPYEYRSRGEISDILYVDYPRYSYGAAPGTPDIQQNGDTAISLGHKVLDSHTHASVLPRPTAEALSGSLIRLTPYQMNFRPWLLQARIEYDENINTMSQYLLPQFADLCVTACKRYIHTNTIIKINKGELQSGQNVGIIKEMVMEYRDSINEYKEQVKKFNRNQPFSMDRLNKILRAFV